MNALEFRIIAANLFLIMGLSSVFFNEKWLIAGSVAGLLSMLIGLYFQRRPKVFLRLDHTFKGDDRFLPHFKLANRGIGGALKIKAQGFRAFGAVQWKDRYIDFLEPNGIATVVQPITGFFKLTLHNDLISTLLQAAKETELDTRCFPIQVEYTDFFGFPFHTRQEIVIEYCTPESEHLQSRVFVRTLRVGLPGRGAKYPTERIKAAETFLKGDMVPCILGLDGNRIFIEEGDGNRFWCVSTSTGIINERSGETLEPRLLEKIGAELQAIKDVGGMGGGEPRRI